LEVYSDIEKQKLKRSGDPIFSKLRSEFDNKHEADEENDDFAFDNGETDKYNRLLETVYAAAEDGDEDGAEGAEDGAGAGANNNSDNKVAPKRNRNNDEVKPCIQSVLMDDGDEVDVDDI
jgi:hypothetical protein